MNKNDLIKMFNTAKRAIGKKSPEILIAFGITGLVTTTVLAVKATIKAVPELEKAEKDNIEKQVKEGVPGPEVRNGVPFPVAVKTVGKYYIPAVVSGAVSIACIIGANSVHSKRNAAIATAYKLSEKALTEYKETVLEEVGEEKAAVIKDKIAQKRIDENPVSSQVIINDSSKQLCYDGISGRYFESDIQTIKAAVNKINETLVYEMYAALNDFYDEINLEHTDIGDEIGWNLDDGLLEISYGSMIAKDGRPCITLDYHISPRYDFSKLM